ncbi:DUF6641 family protein [Limnohabitans sp. 15K]|uniref:DUF6641 family protein n=1 Tax=Limnohabitans sp. 15K TaxID=1100706 RepID=UPI000C1F80AC|nr:DUF6641 family protein [Limnohabitans sp. 15K]PIT82277.1 hypothetical protein B9Z40_00610 [Limnohabitans sp. 15K]
MTAIAKLKLVSSKKERNVSPVVARRNKLAGKIDEQLLFATAQRDGQIYAPKRLKNVIDKATGERKTVEATKRIKEWYWTNSTGKIHLSVRYGSKTLELAKGKNAIELNSGDELLATLATLKEAVIAGELDDAIAQASDKLKAGFTK